MEEKKEAKSRFKRVCVFCGSSPEYKYCYRKAAVDLGNELVPLLFFSLLLIIFYSFKKFSIAWMNLFFKFWVFSHLNVKFFYEGFQGIGSCLWRRKCWLDGFDFRSGSSWWQTCFRVTGYLQSLQINQAVWFYRFDNKFVFIFFSYCQFFIHRIIPKALMKKEVCNEYIYLAPSL